MKEFRFMDIETRLAFIDLIDDVHLLLDVMIERELLEPTESLLIVKGNFNDLKYRLCEPFREVKIEKKSN